MTPQVNILTPGFETSVDAFVRTVSGTSAGGNETSFLDQGYETCQNRRMEENLWQEL